MAVLTNGMEFLMWGPNGSSMPYESRSMKGAHLAASSLLSLALAPAFYCAPRLPCITPLPITPFDSTLPVPRATQDNARFQCRPPVRPTTKEVMPKIQEH